MTASARTTLTININLIQNAVRGFQGINQSIKRTVLAIATLGVVGRRSDSALAGLLRTARKFTSIAVAFFIIRRVVMSARDAILSFIKSAADLQEELLNVQRIAKLTDVSLASLGVNLLTLSIRTGKMAKDLAAIAASVSRAGFTGEEDLLAATETMNKLSLAIGITGERDREAFLRMAKAFDIGARGLERLGDILAVADRSIAGTGRGVLDLSRLLTGLRASTKQTVQEVIALSATFLGIGLNLRTTNFQIGKFFGLLQDPKKARVILSKVAEVLGEDVAEALRTVNEREQGATEALKIFVDLLNSLSVEELSQLLKDLSVTGRRFNVVFTALRTHMGKYLDLLGKLNNEAKTGGELQEQFEIKMKALNRQWDRLARGIGAVRQALATPLLEPLAGKAKKLADNLGKIDFKETIENFSKFWETIFIQLNKAKEKLKELRPILIQIGKGLIGLIALWTVFSFGVSVAVSVFTAGVTIVGLFMLALASPTLALAIVAMAQIAAMTGLFVTGLVVAIVMFKKFANQIALVFGFAESIISGFANKVLDSINTVVNGLIKAANYIANNSVLGMLFKLIAGKEISTTANFDVRNFLPKIPKPSGAGDAAAPLARGFTAGALKLATTEILDVLADLGGVFTAGTKALFENTIGPKIHELLDSFVFTEAGLGVGEHEGLPEGLGPDVAKTSEEIELINQTTTAIDSLSAAVFDLITGVSGIEGFFSNMISSIRDFVKTSFVKAFTSALKEKLNPMFSVLDKVGKALADKLFQIFDPVINLVASFATKILSSILNMLLPGAGSILGALGLQHGTPFVPQTGLAMVHQGEAVIPAHLNRGGGGMVNNWNIAVSGFDDAEEAGNKIYDTIKGKLLGDQRAIHGRARGSFDFARA